jgi:hypothetical protein
LNNPISLVKIKDFPNEAGFFMLWEMSISENDNDGRILPIFVNHEFLLRPMAGKRLLEVFLDKNTVLNVGTTSNISTEEYRVLEKLSADFALDTFVDLKEKQVQLNQERYNKYMYALNLRLEAVENIKIENIRKSRLAKLQKEEAVIEEQFNKGKLIYPEFRLVMLVRLEA